jgi:nitrogen-specific signal transduction histidine kinase
MGVDISERKKLEEQLRKSQKMEAMGLLAGGIAHDFNNLLTGILGYASLLSLKEGVPPEVTKAAGIIQRSAERASQLTAQLLGFAEQGKNLTVPVELGRVIASVTGVLERTQDPLIRIATSLRPEGGCVLGDPSQLDQVVMNLAINACDAMPAGGQLKITTEPVTLDEAFCRERDWMSPGKYLLLSVIDTGVGISPENMERIFDPFFTTKSQGKGTGLGLSMVFGIVKNHGGCVDVQSERGAGTVFRVYLPEGPEGALKEKAAMDEALPRGRGKILLVDDQDTVREVANDMLEALGYEVITAADGMEGDRPGHPRHGHAEPVGRGLLPPDEGDQPEGPRRPFLRVFDGRGHPGSDERGDPRVHPETVPDGGTLPRGRNGGRNVSVGLPCFC